MPRPRSLGIFFGLLSEATLDVLFQCSHRDEPTSTDREAREFLTLEESPDCGALDPERGLTFVNAQQQAFNGFR